MSISIVSRATVAGGGFVFWLQEAEPYMCVCGQSGAAEKLVSVLLGRVGSAGGRALVVPVLRGAGSAVEWSRGSVRALSVSAVSRPRWLGHRSRPP